jgi:hypothetical protein
VSQFVPEEYAPEGGFSAAGLPVLLAGLCAAAVGLGWLASFIGQWFYLILVFPAAIGLGLIGAGVLLGRLTKMRSPGLAVLFGLLSAAVAILAMHYFNYQRFLKQREEILKSMPDLDDPQAQPLNAKEAEAVQFFRDARAVNSFPSYMTFEARQGVTLSGRGKSGLNLGWTGTWIYWGLELAGVAAMAIFGLIGGAAAPFCATCKDWKQERPLGTLKPKDTDVAAILRGGEIERLKAYDPALAGGNLLVTAAVCPRCLGESPISVRLVHVSQNEKGEELQTELAHVTYPGAALAEFEVLFGLPPTPRVGF